MSQVRIVHPGGPACLMRVYVGEDQLLPVNKVEIILDAASRTMVGARLTVFDVDLDIIAELDEAQAISPVPRDGQPTNGTDPLQPPAAGYRSNLVEPTGRIRADAFTPRGMEAGPLEADPPAPLSQSPHPRPKITAPSSSHPWDPETVAYMVTEYNAMVAELEQLSGRIVAMGGDPRDAL